MSTRPSSFSSVFFNAARRQEMAKFMPKGTPPLHRLLNKPSNGKVGNLQQVRRPVTLLT